MYDGYAVVTLSWLFLFSGMVAVLLGYVSGMEYLVGRKTREECLKEVNINILLHPRPYPDCTSKCSSSHHNRIMTTKDRRKPRLDLLESTSAIHTAHRCILVFTRAAC
jgi:hypothetical protein